MVNYAKLGQLASAPRDPRVLSRIHEGACKIQGRQARRFHRRLLTMALVFAAAVLGFVGIALYGAASEDQAALPRMPERRLHEPLLTVDRDGASIANECFDGMTAQEWEDEEVESNSIQAFQVITQKKYMLTIYGCAVGGGQSREEDVRDGNICLRDEYKWMLPIYVMGLLYMFAGLAIICDEFFVPALELFTTELGLSDDVAGATFMAAGGSMPELFTSFIGTFNESDIGFAAIVGSAVFNVLFVIAVCTLASEKPLELTWWPLFRDVAWYLLSLTLVAFVFKGTSPNQIETWEAALLFATYLSYATFMKFNPQIEKKVKSLLGKDEVECMPGHELDSNGVPQLVKPSTFRVGIFQLLTQNADIGDTAGIAAVTKIKGNLKEIYDRFDKNGNGTLCEEEVIEMLKELCNNEADTETIAKQLRSIEPRSGDGSIGFDAFQKWYIASEARVAFESRRVFDHFDADKSGTIDHKEIGSLLKNLGHGSITDEEVARAMAEVIATGKTVDVSATPVEKVAKADKNAIAPTPIGATAAEKAGDDVAMANCEQITFEQFDKWYSQSVFWQEQHQQHINEQEAEASGFSIFWPEGATKVQTTWFIFTYPIAAMMYCTMPDVRREGRGTFRVAILEFICSLAWIAVFSLCLYDWLVTLCNTIGFPPNVAAVTVLAGGTSIPDLLSSYVVARQGQGDMAVSSSIGSNIFDVTVGLPLPWLMFTMINGRNVVVGAESLFSSVLILIMMLIGVIVTIMLCKWKLSKPLGCVMMCLYVVFVLQQMLQDFGVINYGI